MQQEEQNRQSVKVIETEEEESQKETEEENSRGKRSRQRMMNKSIRRTRRKGCKGEEKLGCSVMHYMYKISNRLFSGNARSSFK
jgi:hypothetical protein